MTRMTWMGFCRRDLVFFHRGDPRNLGKWEFDGLAAFIDATFVPRKTTVGLVSIRIGGYAFARAERSAFLPAILRAVAALEAGRPDRRDGLVGPDRRDAYLPQAA